MQQSGSHAAGDEGTDGEFMQILQGYIFGDVCYTGSLDNRLRELGGVSKKRIDSCYQAWSY